jgi:hypothetical protein
MFLSSPADNARNIGRTIDDYRQLVTCVREAVIETMNAQHNSMMNYK